jgi:chloramphenicol 3-O phosphotransferase
VTTQVIVLNGGSSSGKSGIVRCLKYLLPNSWINLGVDDLIDRLPPSMVMFGPQGEVILGKGFGDMQYAWTLAIHGMTAFDGNGHHIECG